MFDTLPQQTQDEIRQLASEYGQPIVRTVELGINKSFDPLNKTDRYGEVCMVVRRLNGKLLTMTKTYYPTDAYRLLTGGINHGESIFHGLLRETQEETGLKVSVQRFLAIAAYRMVNVEQPVFYSFAFLLDEVSGTLGAIDESEQVEDFQEIAPSELPAVASTLEHVGDQYSNQIGGTWGDWGRFRAVIHHLVWEAWQS